MKTKRIGIVFREFGVLSTSCVACDVEEALDIC
jgi:hypothetical protein